MYNDGKPWMRKRGGGFNVNMAVCYGAEVCELIGIQMLFSIVKNNSTKNFGVYKDDGLCAFNNESEPALDKVKKYFQF